MFAYETGLNVSLNSHTKCSGSPNTYGHTMLDLYS